MKRSSVLHGLAVVAFAATALVAVACGGGASTPQAPNSLPPTTTPTSSPTPTAPPASSSMIVGPNATSAPIPSAGGFSGSISFPSSNLSAPTTLAATTSFGPPSGMTPLMVRHSFVARRSAGSSGMNVYFYETITSPVAVTFNGIPGFTIAFPASIPLSGLYFYIGYFNANTNAWVDPILGPATIAGNTLSFAGNSSQDISMTANVPLTLAFYSLTSPTPTPTPAAITLSPSSAQIDGTGSSAQATFIATAASGGQVTISPTSTCLTNASTLGVASISPMSAPSGNTFTVTATDAGTCAFVVTDVNGDTTSESINIATTTITGQ